ncbi:hypothetical protein AAMO2058_001049900 [Amorphochlora amoebiformis]|mmetsp:Transcript_28891/g.46185  ORF Transcript_28891/g.46185 Transcript_28891/m.46185 type:complete len:598 (-) Transcript_28891:375-2168(-)
MELPWLSGEGGDSTSQGLYMQADVEEGKESQSFDAEPTGEGIPSLGPDDMPGLRPSEISGRLENFQPGAIPESFLEPLTVLPPGPTQSESSSRKQPTEEPQEEEEEPEYLAETEERKPPPSQTSHHPSAIFFHRAPPHYQAPSSQPPPPTPTPTRPRVPRTAKPMIVGQEARYAVKIEPGEEGQPRGQAEAPRPRTGSGRGLAGDWRSVQPREGILSAMARLGSEESQIIAAAAAAAAQASSVTAQAAANLKAAPPEHGESRKRQRLARKAQLARQSRKRKKDRIGQLRKQSELLRQAIEEEREQQQRTARCPFCRGKGAQEDVKYVDMSKEEIEVESGTKTMIQVERQREMALLTGTSPAQGAGQQEDPLGVPPIMGPGSRTTSRRGRRSARRTGRSSLEGAVVDTDRFLRTIFQHANESYVRAWAHLESLRDSVELCPPSRFLAWALGFAEVHTSTQRRGIWQRLWVGELGLQPDTIRRIEGMQDLCRRLHTLSRRLRRALQPAPPGPPEASTTASASRSKPAAPAPAPRPRRGVRGKSELTAGSPAIVLAGSNLQALEIECLERIREILAPTDMIRFCVWADQNRLTIAALDEL